MTKLWRFLVAAFVIEALAIAVTSGRWPAWIMDIIVVCTLGYFVMLGVRGWRKQAKLTLPPIMHGVVVHKRHWRLF